MVNKAEDVKFQIIKRPLKGGTEAFGKSLLRTALEAMEPNATDALEIQNSKKARIATMLGTISRKMVGRRYMQRAGTEGIIYVYRIA